MGPLPAPTPIGEKRRYAYSTTRESQWPLASSVEGVEGESGSSKLQPIKSQPSFKQEPPKFATLASAEQGAAAVSSQMQAQGRQALSSGMTPAVNQIFSQFKARQPQASPEQITRMTTDQLYKMSNEARQHAMSSGVGNSNATAVVANANIGLQVPSSMQQQAAMMANGGGGPIFNIGNSQQYAQLMRQQQQSQQRGAGAGG